MKVHKVIAEIELAVSEDHVQVHTADVVNVLSVVDMNTLHITPKTLILEDYDTGEVLQSLAINEVEDK